MGGGFRGGGSGPRAAGRLPQGLLVAEELVDLRPQVLRHLHLCGRRVKRWSGMVGEANAEIYSFKK